MERRKEERECRERWYIYCREKAENLLLWRFPV
jgi:hypothetical protein